MNRALPHSARYLRRFVRAARWMSLLRALALAALCSMSWLLVWGLVDRLFQLPATMRVMLLIMLLAIIVWMLARPLAALLRSTIDWQSAARLVEERDSRFGEELITVVSYRDGATGASPELVNQLSQEVESILTRQPVAPIRIVGMRAVIRAGSAAIVGFALMLALTLWPWLGLRELVARQLKPISDVQSVGATHPDTLYEVKTTGPFETRVARPVTVSQNTTASPTTQSSSGAQYHDALEAYFRALGQINPAAKGHP